MIYKNYNSNLKMAFLLVLIIFLYVGCGNKIEPSKPLIKPISKETNTPPQDLERLRQEYEKILDLLNEKIHLFGLKSLRKVELGDDDLEVRVWKGIGYPTLSGIILGRKENKWKAVYFPTSYFPDFQGTEKSLKPNLTNLDSPVIGWDKLWRGLKEQDILTNKDDIDTEAGVVEPFEDSIIITVEVLIRKGYRHYSYHAPCYSKAEEAKKLLKAVKILEENFKISLHDCDRD